MKRAADVDHSRDSNSLARPDGSHARVVELLELIATELRSLRTAIETRTSETAPDVLTAHDFAALLRIDERTLREMRNAGEVPRGFMCGRSPRWKRSTIEAWIARTQR